MLTDNETTRALKECLTEPCSEQAYINAVRNALDLINRKKAEVERLKTHLEELPDEVEDKMTYMCGCKNCIETVKRIIKDDVKPFDMYCDSCNRCKHREVEAVKDFTDLVIKNIRENVTPISQQMYLINMCIQEIENTKKEMVGEG